MSEVVHGHSSSLYSESPSKLAKEVGKGVTYNDPPANVITYTEVGSAERTQVLKDADPAHWAAWVAGQSDVGLMWRKQEFSPVWKEPHKLTNKTWTDGHGRKHETWCATALLQHVDGPTLFLSVCHLPSHVQNGGKFYDNAQAAAWKSAVNGWSTYWNNIRKRDHPTLAMLCGDWNVDVHNSTWMQRVGDYFPSMFNTWAGKREPPNNQGTHGKRLIDFTMSTSKPVRARLLKDNDSSDHRPYGEAIPWP